MKVLKFGGTSVGTTESLRNVKKIAESIDGAAIIIVSALGGLTDKLIATAKMAAAGDAGYRTEMEGISARHFNIIDDVVDADRRSEVIEAVSGLLEELKRMYDGVALIQDLPEKTLNTIVSFGERMSSIIVAAMIRNAEWHNSLDYVRTEKWFNKNIADTALTNSLIVKEFEGIKERGRLAVAGGFISTDRDTGEITNLGRGGSDYTAALIAAALDAEVLEIWTDVDGFMTADPRIIKDAFVLPHMTFIESMELCSFGAKVIYPPTIYPVFHKNIPIKILNTFNPEARGTLITDTVLPEDTNVKGISSIRNTVLICLRGELTANVAEINSRTYNCLARQGISVHLVSQPNVNDHFSFSIGSQDIQATVNVLRKEFAPELSDGRLDEIKVRESLATIAVVGERLGKIQGIGQRIANTLLRNDIDVLAASDGSSDTTVTFVVALDKADTAMRLIHSLLF